MPDRLEKLWEQVKKTGFPLEMRVIEALVNRGWTVSSSSTYFDEDEDRKPRELDVKAIKNYHFGRMSAFSNVQYSLHITLTIQCKQSTKGGWVFFPVIGRRNYPRLQRTDFLSTIKKHTLFISDPKRNRAHLRFLGLAQDLANEPPLTSAKAANSLERLSEKLPYRIFDIKTLTNLTSSQTGVSLGFKKPKPHPDLFEAAMTSTKPSIQAKELQTYIDYQILTGLLRHIRYGGNEFASRLAISFFIPMVIFDGVICFWKGDEERPVETERVGYQFMNRSPSYFGEYYIPIISSTDFTTFIDELESDFEKLSKKMSKKVDYIDSQVQIVIENTP